MKLEHFALNVPEPIAMAEWYVRHLGMKIVREQKESPFMHFLADDSDQIMIEIYNNPLAEVPDYPSMDTLLVHLAFVASDPTAVKETLLEAGATHVSDTHLDDGSHLVMMRDPWGVGIQFCKRGAPMI